jgi:hypothetical protein
MNFHLHCLNQKMQLHLKLLTHGDEQKIETEIKGLQKSKSK